MKYMIKSDLVTHLFETYIIRFVFRCMMTPLTHIMKAFIEATQ